MANSAVMNGSFTLISGTARSVGTLASTITLSGTNYVGINQNIGTGSYVPLTTASLSDVRAMFFGNQDISGSISVARDSAGTKEIVILLPGDGVYLTWSGSIEQSALFAKTITTPANGLTSTLEYIITES